MGEDQLALFFEVGVTNKYCVGGLLAEFEFWRLRLQFDGEAGHLAPILVVMKVSADDPGSRFRGAKGRGFGAGTLWIGRSAGVAGGRRRGHVLG